MLFPTEIWLLILQFLTTRDLVFLSLACHDLKYIIDDEIRKRSNINNVLSQYMTDVNRFRSVMRTTRSFITGDFTIAFFTGDNLPSYVEIFFDQDDLKSHLRSWFKFFKQEDKIGEGLKILSNGTGKVNFFV